MDNGFIIVFLGTSGSGKSYIIRNILPELSDEFKVVKKYISRKPRADEIDENGNLIVSDIIPDSSIDEILNLDYNYCTVREYNSQEVKGYYGFSKSSIDEILQEGNIPVINKCDKKTYKQLLLDYPNRVLTIKVEGATFKNEIVFKTMLDQGRNKEELSSRINEEDNQDFCFTMTSNARTIINCFVGRDDAIYSQAINYFVKLQLVKLFLNIYKKDNTYFDLSKFSFWSKKYNELIIELNSKPDVKDAFDRYYKFFFYWFVNQNFIREHWINKYGDKVLNLERLQSRIKSALRTYENDDSFYDLFNAENEEYLLNILKGEVDTL